MKGKIATRKHVFILNGMRPMKGTTYSPRACKCDPQMKKKKLTLDILRLEVKNKKKFLGKIYGKCKTYFRYSLFYYKE